MAKEEDGLSDMDDDLVQLISFIYKYLKNNNNKRGKKNSKYR